MIRNISYKLRYNNFLKSKAGILTIAIGIIIIISLIVLTPHLHRNTYKVTVTNKQIVTRKNTTIYLIYTQTEDGKIRVFKNTNSFVELKFNSEDIYWAISANKKYEISAYGFNIPILLEYQNLVKVKGI